MICRFLCWIFSSVASVSCRYSFFGRHDCPATVKLVDPYIHTSTQSLKQLPTKGIGSLPCALSLRKQLADVTCHTVPIVFRVKGVDCMRESVVANRSAIQVQNAFLAASLRSSKEKVISLWADNWQCVRKPARIIRLRKSMILPYLFHKIIYRENIA